LPAVASWPASVARRRPWLALPSASGHQPKELGGGQVGQGHQQYRHEAGYWAGQIQPGLGDDSAQTIAELLQDVAGSPWLPAHMEHWARAWTASLEELTSERAGS
jgi:hypothetical protein